MLWYQELLARVLPRLEAYLPSKKVKKLSKIQGSFINSQCGFLGRLT